MVTLTHFRESENNIEVIFDVPKTKKSSSSTVMVAKFSVVAGQCSLLAITQMTGGNTVAEGVKITPSQTLMFNSVLWPQIKEWVSQTTKLLM